MAVRVALAFGLLLWPLALTTLMLTADPPIAEVLRPLCAAMVVVVAMASIVLLHRILNADPQEGP